MSSTFLFISFVSVSRSELRDTSSCIVSWRLAGNFMFVFRFFLLISVRIRSVISFDRRLGKIIIKELFTLRYKFEAW